MTLRQSGDLWQSTPRENTRSDKDARRGVALRKEVSRFKKELDSQGIRAS